jgi:hypothetical protein
MGIGFSIFLIALGAIIAFGVDYQLNWLDLAVVGWVLMLAGITGLILTLYFWSRRRRTTDVVAERRYHDGRPVNPPYAERTRYRDPRPGTRPVEPTEPLPTTRPTEPLPERGVQTTRREYREGPAPPG